MSNPFESVAEQHTFYADSSEVHVGKTRKGAARGTTSTAEGAPDPNQDYLRRLPLKEWDKLVSNAGTKGMPHLNRLQLSMGLSLPNADTGDLPILSPAEAHATYSRKKYTPKKKDSA
jgi:hypothetical protein